MFNSGVFSPFLGLCANAQALNVHAMLSSPVCMRDGVLPACRVSGGSRLPPCCSRAGRVLGAQVGGGSILSP